MPECSVAIENILFDADGVLQYAKRHWKPALQSVLNLDNALQAKAVLDDVFEAETEALETGGGFIERLEAVLAKWGRSDFLSETLNVLHAIEVHQDVMQTVQAIRRLGIRCHIGSNQQAARAKHMSEGLNYRHLFDTEFYSCFVGLAKPKVGFFEKVVAQLGCDASAMLFVDDRAENVEAARKAGLNAFVFYGSDGATVLARHLASFGVFVDR